MGRLELETRAACSEQREVIDWTSTSAWLWRKSYSVGSLKECPSFSLPVVNGHTLCLRLLLEIADNPEAVDVRDGKGQ